MNDLTIFQVSGPPGGEVFSPADQTIRVMAAPHPLRAERKEFFFPAGTTVEEIVAGVQPNPNLRRAAHVFIGEDLIARSAWRLVRPKPHALVTVRMIPMGGGNKILRMVLMLAVTALAIAATVLTAGTAFALAYPILTALIPIAITTIGTVLINTLIPPASPRMKDLSSQNESPTLSVTGARNQLAVYSPIPRVYGRHRVVPPYGARPYTEILGKDQWLRLLFDLGYGPLELSELKIGETPIENFDDVEYEIRQGFLDDQPTTLYSRSVFEEPFSILLQHLTGSPPTEQWSTRTSQPNADELSIDVTFFSGLTQFLNDGSRVKRSVEIAAEYSLAGANDWKALTAEVTVAAQSTGALGGIRTVIGPNGRSYVQRTAWTISLDQYSGMAKIGRTNVDIPICHVARQTGGAVVITDQRPAAFTSVSPEYFVPTYDATHNVIDISSGVLVLPSWRITDNSATAVRSGLKVNVPRGQYEVRLKRITVDSTDDRIFDEVSWTALRTIRNILPVIEKGHCLVAMRIKATDQLNGVVDEFNCIAESILLDFDGTDWVERVTSNPAAIDLDVLRGSANGDPVSDDLLDGAAYEEWSLANAAAGREFNGVIDFETTVFEMRKMVCVCGRAAPTMRDGRFSIVRDVVQTVPVQHFTPRNSWGFKGNKAFPDLPHALRIRFVDRTAGWQSSERIVYDDGYGPDNSTRFDILDMFGVTDPEQIWKDGRYLQAVAKLRAEFFELNCDFEHLVAGQGDLVLLTHDVIAVGLASARIASVTVAGTGDAISHITIDETVTMVETKNYGVSIRALSGQVTVQVVTVPGDHQVLTLSTPIPYSSTLGPPQATIAAGDLLGFGELGRETLQCLVKTLEPGAEMVAKISLVPHSPAVHDAENGEIPPFDPLVTPLPRTPLPPIVISVDSGNLALLMAKDGTIQSRIAIALMPAPGSVPAVRYQGMFRPAGSDVFWVSVPDGTAAGGILSIMPVQDGETYDIRVRAISQLGSPSEWVYINSHTVLGKTAPPPEPDTFTVARLADGTRRFNWTLVNEPADVRAGGGYEIRWKLGDTTDWDAMTVLPPGFLVGKSLETNQLSAGTYTFAIKTIDSSGNYSLVARFIQGAVLGDPRLRNVLLQSIENELGWPGTRTDCFIDSDNVLRAVSDGDWSDLAATWSAIGVTWDDILPHKSPIRYTTPVFDVEADISFTPLTDFFGVGTPTIEMKTGTESDGTVVGAFVPVGQVTSQRYIQLRISVAGAKPSIAGFTVTLDAEIIEVDLEDILTSAGDSATFDHIAAGHFRVAPEHGITLVVRAMISAFQNAGSGWTWELLDKSADIGGLLAAEFKIYKDGVLTDATVDVNIKGLR